MSADSLTVVEQQLRKMIAALREENSQLGEDKRRLQERLAGALEENSRLQRVSNERLEKLEEERRDLIEEMKAGWAFETTELRAEIARLSAELTRSAAEVVSLTERLSSGEAHRAKLFSHLCSYLLPEEAEARSAIEKEEASAVLPPSLAQIREQCIQFPATDDLAAGEGLFTLYKYVRSGTVSAAVARELLKERDDLTELYFNTADEDEGQTHFSGGACSISRNDMVPFLDTVVFELPALRSLFLNSLPLLTECLVPLVERIPPTLEGLFAHSSPFSVDDLIVITQGCPTLRDMEIHSSYCIDWGEFGAIEDEEAREEAVNHACRGILDWY